MTEEGPLRLYLDTCVFNRPFDDQSQPRIWLETLAFSVIMQMIEDKTVVLVASSVVSYDSTEKKLLHPSPGAEIDPMTGLRATF